ncbi:hypothetical protein Cob_v007183 [Colletotrichum orbiculare MAFF 240422]|uniref:Uncharacterized protein n=1 Tax=Colletotrichum orbiculare (strain 104-T / ATCC 96160 / CBS 514.97 / LARS 414 / MAFF 240422) TaxID=1213857 RepID=A0A484FQ45_COLOR|nr:hypothetical protein Cob_v007183 [Colletotrichum orbiculare MAFF 240422]
MHGLWVDGDWKDSAGEFLPASSSLSKRPNCATNCKFQRASLIWYRTSRSGVLSTLAFPWSRQYEWTYCGNSSIVSSYPQLHIFRKSKLWPADNTSVFELICAALYSNESCVSRKRALCGTAFPSTRASSFFIHSLPLFHLSNLSLNALFYHLSTIIATMLFRPSQIVLLALGLLSATASAAPTEFQPLEGRAEVIDIGACYDSRFTCAFQGCFAVGLNPKPFGWFNDPENAHQLP